MKTYHKVKWLIVVYLTCFSALCWSSRSSETLSFLFSDYVEQRLKLDPITATLQGDTRYLATLPFEFSEDSRKVRLALEREFLARAEKVTSLKLSRTENLDLNIFKYQRRLAIESFEFPEHLLPMQSLQRMVQVFPYLGSGKGPQPFNRVADYENWYNRMEGLPEYVEQVIQRLEEGVKEGIVFPAEIVDKLITALQGFQVELVENSVYYQPVIDMPLFFIPNQKQYVILRYTKMINKTILPSYQKLENYLKLHYRQAAITSVTLSHLTQREDWYRHLIKRHTGSALTPQEIHQYALEALVKINLKMEQIKFQAGYEGTLKQFFKYMETSSKFAFESPAQMLEQYQSFSHKVNETIPKVFSTFPKATYQVKLADQQAARTPLLTFSKAADASAQTAAVFYLNPYQIAQHKSWMLESTFIQRAVPGALFQSGIEKELATIPKFRNFSSENVYHLGWSLYVVSLGEELGFFIAPFQQYGALQLELIDTIKLLVDTGIHGLGWPRTQALAFVQNNTPITESQASSLIDFVIANPAQSTAAGIGYWEFKKLRATAQNKLKSRFNIKEFHQQLLEDGALPMPILEQKISAWIKKQER